MPTAFDVAPIGPTSGGKVYAYNDLNTTPKVVVPANQFRIRVTFHNPGALDVYVAPKNVVNSGSQVALTPSTSALGGCFIVYANGGEKAFTGECQGEWQAFSASGSGNPLTVIDSNV